jgi:hypothetical protein
MIDATSFGTMTIGGRTYNSDLKIFPDGHITDGWWRKRGHVLDVDDILDLVDAAPETIVVGTGTSGRMRPTTSLVAFLGERGIACIAESTPAAMATYNEKIAAGVRTGACFHLTC